MKNFKKILTGLLVAAPALLFAQSGNFTIIGKVGVSSPSKKVYLLNTDDTTGRIDSVVSVNGNFTFKGTVTEPTIYWIIVKGKQDDGRPFPYTRPYHCFKFFAIPGVINITSADSILNAKVSGGGLVNKEYDELRTIREKVYQDIMRRRPKNKNPPNIRLRFKKGELLQLRNFMQLRSNLQRRIPIRLPGFVHCLCTLQTTQWTHWMNSFLICFQLISGQVSMVRPLLR